MSTTYIKAITDSLGYRMRSDLFRSICIAQEFDYERVTTYIESLGFSFNEFNATLTWEEEIDIIHNDVAAGIFGLEYGDFNDGDKT